MKTFKINIQLTLTTENEGTGLSIKNAIENVFKHNSVGVVTDKIDITETTLFICENCGSEHTQAEKRSKWTCRYCQGSEND